MSQWVIGDIAVLSSSAIERGWLWKHESGTYVKLTQTEADLFHLAAVKVAPGISLGLSAPGLVRRHLVRTAVKGPI